MDYNNFRVGFGKRCFASLIDLILAFIFGMIIFSPILLFVESDLFEKMMKIPIAGSWPALGILVALFTFGVIGLLLATFFNFYMDFKKGGTLGKRRLGLTIKNEDGSAPETNTLLKRAALKYGGIVMILLSPFYQLAALIGPLLMLVIFVGFFFVLGEKKQSFHDRFSKTAVFKRSL